MSDQRGGVIAWMVDNRVTPNLLMLVLLIGGIYMTTVIKQEVFPEFAEDTVTISVPYPGASPEEVEKCIVLAVEESIRGLDGVKEIRATASEGAGTVVAELLEDADQQKTYQDIKQQIDRITTFPDDAEEPEVSLDVRRREVLTLQIYGDVDEWALRETVEQVRDQLLQHPSISQIELRGARDYEVVIEVSQEALRAYGLTIGEIADRVRSSSVEIPGGRIETASGEILLRVDERRDWASEFRRIPVVTGADGSFVYLEEVATITDGFDEDADEVATYNGHRAIGVSVYRIGDQTPMGVASAVRAAMHEIEQDMAPGIDWVIQRDMSEVYAQRLSLLTRNAVIGLVLVMVILGLFLEIKLAFWVMMGIPISFLGGLLIMPGLGVTINMISMFAFIIALGIVVDDAIVAGENVYEYRQMGMSRRAAAIKGAQDVAIPITFAILTNVVAFLPLYFVPGFMGKIWRVIPLVVCTVFLVSLVEALFILPSHLAHSADGERNPVIRWIHRRQQAFSVLVSRLIEGVFGPSLRFLMTYRYLLLAAGFSVVIWAGAYVASGRIGIILMPRTESDSAVVTAALPYGSPMSTMERVRETLVEAGSRVVDEAGGDTLSDGVFAFISGNSVEVTFYLTEPDVRPMSTGEFVKRWRDAVGEVVGLESLKFESDRGGPGSGEALTVELSHRDIDTLDQASEALAARLAEFSVVKDIDDGYTPGKRQYDFAIEPAGESLGLTAMQVATQVRNAFQGNEAFRQQRGRNEVTIRVRRPEAERASMYDVENLIIQTPQGDDVPLLDVATVTPGRAYTSIQRRDGRRTVTVSADVDPVGETSRVQAAMEAEVLPELARDYAGLSYTFEGKQADFAESFQALMRGMAIALLTIYILLAIPFKSYLQPAVVMLAIPFGVVGALIGHVLMGYNLSIMSIMGVVALGGVVVNDSLVLIEYTNRLRLQEGLSAFESVCRAAVRRFRPILLTTLTTFGGLAPMIFETSRQARFLIPMALSLGFGILFATAITLLIVPALYLMIDDLKRLLQADHPEDAYAPRRKDTEGEEAIGAA
ncbi:MAG: efflux RND transporter permease subunit [Phycisphaerales bacterium JB059]